MKFGSGRALCAMVGLALTLLPLTASSSTAPKPNALGSTLIRNATVVDGTGNARRTASVRIQGDRIAAVGLLAPRRGERIVDASGLVLAPGFIDTHSHHDMHIFEDRNAAAAISQGITTIVVGPDGYSNLPLSTFFAKLQGMPAAVNVASYTGHGQIRAAVMGEDYKRAARPDEIARMKDLLRRDLASGAIGLSTGLEYDPGAYSTAQEVLELAQVTAAAGGRYSSHIRSEDRKLWESVDEIIEIGRRTGMPVHLSHAKLAMVDWWGQAPRMIAKLDAARKSGVDITSDVYPYEYWQSTLRVLFLDRNFTDRAAAEFALKSIAPPDGLRLSRYKPEPALVGKTVAAIARMRGTDEAQTLMDLIAAAPGPEDESVIGTSMRADDIATLIKWPHVNICTDGMLRDRHPRGAGSFTRVLREYVRERELLTLEEAIRKMTSLAAKHAGIVDRGVIRPGAYADLVLFDPARVADRATIQTPGALSVGINRVWVNGRSVLTDGKPDNVWPGRVIRRVRRS